MLHPRRLDSLVQAYRRRGVPALEEALAQIPPSAAWLDVLIQACAEPQQAICATWMLRAYLAGEAHLDPRQTAALLRLLVRVKDRDARLHLCQAVGDLQIPARNAGQLARFLEDCASAPAKFLRAWGVDGFHRLALQHPSHRPRARGLLERAAQDPAASVRARVRRIRAEES